VVEISNEPLVMVHGDIKPCNFLIDPKTLRVTIIDFGGISALPRSFVNFTMHATRDEFYFGY
jgi:serine/threonine protein kinase